MGINSRSEKEENHIHKGSRARQMLNSVCKGIYCPINDSHNYEGLYLELLNLILCGTYIHVLLNAAFTEHMDLYEIPLLKQLHGI